MRRFALVIASTLMLCLGAVPASVSARGVGSPDQRESSASGGPALTRFRVVDHNIEHKASALKRVLQRAHTTGAQAITVQEICWWQARDLQREHPGWTVAWKRDKQSGWCLQKRHGGLFSSGPNPRGIGVAAIWTGGGRGVTSTMTFRTQRADDRIGLACVTWIRGARQRVCSVHLLSPHNDKQARMRFKQARELRHVAAKWVRRDDLVVLGGDFNTQPTRPTLDNIYRLDGRGDFREATPPRVGLAECRCTQITGDGGRAKIDYIFFSANRMASGADRSLRVTPTASDHHMLSGWARVDASAHR